jgi:hypothetical protein
MQNIAKINENDRVLNFGDFPTFSRVYGTGKVAGNRLLKGTFNNIARHRHYTQTVGAIYGYKSSYP